jgi:hypothetical protein
MTIFKRMKNRSYTHVPTFLSPFQNHTQKLTPLNTPEEVEIIKSTLLLFFISFNH